MKGSEPRPHECQAASTQVTVPTGIINSGWFLEIAHGALGRHDRRWRDPRDLVRVLAREPLRWPDRGDREGTPGRRAYLAAEHGRHPSAVLPGPGRATGLCAILPGRLRNVEGVRGPTRIAVVARRNIRGRDPSRAALPSREVPDLGARERDGRRRTRIADRRGCAAARTERTLLRERPAHDGHGRRLPGVHTGAPRGSGTGGREIPPRIRGRVD